MSFPGYRPLHPALSSQASSSSNNQDNQSAGSGRAHARSNVSTACQLCRKQRRKCEAAKPCRACVERGIECIYDPVSDRRRKDTQKRDLDELHHIRDILFGLLESVRISSPTQLSDFQALVNQDADLDQIASWVDESLSNIPSQHDVGRVRPASGTEISYESRASIDLNHGNRARQDMTLERLCDIPPLQVPARPWTSITDDDDLVSHLISLYFTWENEDLRLVEADAFIHDMKTGNIGGAFFCSPFLVNAMLAIACVHSGRVQDIGRVGNQSNLSHRFFNEAKRLWDLENGRTCLTNVQGLCLLGHWYGTNGIDNMTLLINTQSVLMSRKLGLHSPVNTNASAKKQQAYATASWGIAAAILQASLSWRKPSLLQDYQPTTDWTVGHFDFTWAPYPLLHQPLDALRIEYFEIDTRLYMFTNEILNSIYVEQSGGNSWSILWAKAINIHERMLEWWTMAQPVVKPTPLSPYYIYALSLRFQRLIIDLFFPFHNLPPTNLASDYVRYADYLCIQAAVEISSVIQKFSVSFGLGRGGFCFPIFPTLTMSTLLDHLHIGDYPSANLAAVFHDAALQLLGYMSQRPIAKALFRFLYIKCQERHNNGILDETQELFRNFNENTWRTGDHKRFSSDFPDFTQPFRGERAWERVTVSDVLERWETVSSHKQAIDSDAIDGEAGDDDTREGEADTDP